MDMDIMTLIFAYWPLAVICLSTGLAARLLTWPWYYRAAVGLLAITVATVITGFGSGLWRAAFALNVTAASAGFILPELAASAQANLRHPRAIRWIIGLLLIAAAVMTLGSGAVDADRAGEIGGQLILLAIVIYGIATMFRGPRRGRDRR